MHDVRQKFHLPFLPIVIRFEADNGFSPAFYRLPEAAPASRTRCYRRRIGPARVVSFGNWTQVRSC